MARSYTMVSPLVTWMVSKSNGPSVVWNMGLAPATVLTPWVNKKPALKEPPTSPHKVKF